MKPSHEKPEKKSCRCWLCKAIVYCANEFPKKEKRTSKALLFEEYKDIIETTNIKGYELVYSKDKDDSKSIYSAYAKEDSSSNSNMTSEEEYIELSSFYILKVKNWEENTVEEIISSYCVNLWSFVYDYCLYHETNSVHVIKSIVEMFSIDWSSFLIQFPLFI